MAWDGGVEVGGGCRLLDEWGVEGSRVVSREGGRDGVWVGRRGRV